MSCPLYQPAVRCAEETDLEIVCVFCLCPYMLLYTPETLEKQSTPILCCWAFVCKPHVSNSLIIRVKAILSFKEQLKFSECVPHFVSIPVTFPKDIFSRNTFF